MRGPRCHAGRGREGGVGQSGALLSGWEGDPAARRRVPARRAVLPQVSDPGAGGRVPLARPRALAAGPDPRQAEQAGGSHQRDGAGRPSQAGLRRGQEGTAPTARSLSPSSVARPRLSGSIPRLAYPGRRIQSVYGADEPGLGAIIINTSLRLLSAEVRTAAAGAGDHKTVIRLSAWSSPIKEEALMRPRQVPI